VTPRCRIPASRLLFQRAAVFATLALLFGLSGCSTHQRPDTATLDDFARWHESARAQAQAGQLRWSDLYKQSFDRLTALPPSLQQDTRLENTVLLLSTARKYEANEMSAQQFAREREHIETRLEARLR
jgi:hypothetical protein